MILFAEKGITASFQVVQDEALFVPESGAQVETYSMNEEKQMVQAGAETCLLYTSKINERQETTTLPADEIRGAGEVFDSCLLYTSDGSRRSDESCCSGKWTICRSYWDEKKFLVWFRFYEKH